MSTAPRKRKANGRMPKKTRSQELTELFHKTPEMQEYTRRVGTINARLDPGDTVSVTLAIPKQFMSLIEFIEEKNAAEAGGKPKPAKKVLNQILVNELHEQLHWAVVEPARFSHY